jgi:hypothetical protein
VEKILYVPGIGKNLLSIGKFADEGLYSIFGSKTCWILNIDNPLAILLTGTIEKSNSLYRLNSSVAGRALPLSVPRLTANLVTTKQRQKVDLWHKRVGHLNFQSLYNLSTRNMVTGLSHLSLIKTAFEACVIGKYHRYPIPKTARTATTQPLELVHSDLCRPFPQKSLTGSRYILTS